MKLSMSWNTAPLFFLSGGMYLRMKSHCSSSFNLVLKFPPSFCFAAAAISSRVRADFFFDSASTMAMWLWAFLGFCVTIVPQ